MSEHEFEAYLQQLANRLRLSTRQRHHIAGELRDHLEARLDDLTTRGIDRDTAIQQALQEFGDTHTLAHDIATPARRRRRVRIAKALATAAAAVALVATVAVMRPISFPGLEAERAPSLPTVDIASPPPAAQASKPPRTHGTQVIVETRLVTANDRALADAGLNHANLLRTPTPIADQATTAAFIKAATTPHITTPRLTVWASEPAYLLLSTHRAWLPEGKEDVAEEVVFLNQGIAVRVLPAAYSDTQQLTMSFEVLTRWGEDTHNLPPTTSEDEPGRWLGGRYQATWEPGQTLAIELPVDPRTLDFKEFANAEPNDRSILLIRLRALDTDTEGTVTIWPEPA
ncbi:MAG: permease prefix domain 1-containing protein [Planctomycetota bacterium]